MNLTSYPHVSSSRKPPQTHSSQSSSILCGCAEIGVGRSAYVFRARGFEPLAPSAGSSHRIRGLSIRIRSALSQHALSQG
jgi:hypothetical protein